MSERRNLEEQVRAAFAEVPYPGDDNIAYGVGADEPAWHGEPAWVAAEIRGKDWRDLSGDDFASSTPSFLTPAAFQYYLPALLLNLLDELGSLEQDPPRWHETSLVMSTRFGLAPPTHNVYGNERFAGLSRSQRAAVRDVLRYYVSKDPEGIREEGVPSEVEAQAEMLAYWESAVDEAAE